MTHWYRNYQTLLEYASLDISSDMHKQIVDMVWNEDHDGAWGEMVDNYYLRDTDPDYEYPDDFDDNKTKVDHNTEEFKKWFSDWVEERYSEPEYEISSKIKDGKITLYRCITAPKDWKPTPDRHIGIYWSWSESAADAHWGDFSDGNVSWIIKGEVPVEYIDWVVTLAMNASPSYDEEKEVRLKDNAPVTLLGYKQRH